MHGFSDVSMELPFTLTHPKPPADDPAPLTPQPTPVGVTKPAGTRSATSTDTGTQTGAQTDGGTPALDTSLIQLETR
jgi:hypothetical protein